MVQVNAWVNMRGNLYAPSDEGTKDVLALDTLVPCHRPQNRAQCANAQVMMGGNRNALARGICSFENDVAAFLMDDAVTPVAAKSLHKIIAAEVARNLHV
jgi:hypothetical protein